MIPLRISTMKIKIGQNWQNKKEKYTRQIAGKKPPLIPISMIGIERIEDNEKKRFLYKNIF